MWNALLICLAAWSTVVFAAPATLILHNADIWTIDDSKPMARALAIEGNRIVKVGSDSEVLRVKGPETRVIDLQGAFVLPGFIDGHTHFGNAAESFFEVRLVDVNAAPVLLERLQAAAREVPKDMWITGHGWARHAAAEAKAKGEAGFQPFLPPLAEIDRATPEHPVLLRRYDGAYFVNSKGLQLARIDKHTPNPANGEFARDPRTSELTGMLFGSAAEHVAELLPPHNRARELIGARAMLRELSRNGITSIHDMSRVDAISQTKLYRTAVERSLTSLDLFTDLKARGKLTVRVYPILTLTNWRDYAAHGITPGSGDDLIRFGALKTFIDGFYMSKPYANNPNFAGGFSFRVVDEQSLRDEIVGSDALGFDSATHATGDKAHRMMLDWYEAAVQANPSRDRRFRMVHAWYPTRSEVERGGKLRLIADIQPYHLIRELGEINEKLGPERASFGFPWRTMVEQGVRIILSSDWPGSYDRNNVAPLSPLEQIYYAVARRRLDGTPQGGYHAEQALTVDEAIRGYTINPAYAAREESIKGSITVGKLADVVVLSRNIRKIPVGEIPRTQVRYTVFDGKIIHSASGIP